MNRRSSIGTFTPTKTGNINTHNLSLAHQRGERIGVQPKKKYRTNTQVFEKNNDNEKKNIPIQEKLTKIS